MTDYPIVILARGGSKGIPGKNLMDLAGKSLIERSVDVAMDSLFNPVYVYSDSEDITEVARQNGALTVQRPSAVSGDSTTSEETIQEFLHTIDSSENLEALALQQCTTPFIRASDLNAVYKKFECGEYDSVLTVARFERFLGYETERIPGVQDESEFVPFSPYRQLRQDSWPMWMENGGIYMARRNLWTAGRRIGIQCGIVEMEWWRSMEIDYPLDLKVARSIAHLFLEGDIDGQKKEEGQTGVRETIRQGKQGGGT